MSPPNTSMVILLAVSSLNAATPPQPAFRNILTRNEFSWTRNTLTARLMTTSGADAPGLPGAERSRISFVLARNVVVRRQFLFHQCLFPRLSFFPAYSGRLPRCISGWPFACLFQPAYSGFLVESFLGHLYLFLSFTNHRLGFNALSFEHPTLIPAFVDGRFRCVGL